MLLPSSQDINNGILLGSGVILAINVFEQESFDKQLQQMDSLRAERAAAQLSQRCGLEVIASAVM